MSFVTGTPPRPVAGRALTASAAAIVFGALLLPNDIDLIRPGAFLAIPAEALLAATLVLAVPASLISYLETYGDENLVVVLLGDHQPSPIVTGATDNRDVPITIVAKDPAVLDRIDGWRWQDGLRPGPHAPVWPMDAFRERFLRSFSDTASSGDAVHGP